MTENKQKKKLKPSVRKWGLLLGKLACIAVVFTILTQYVFGFVYVRGNYMFPNIKDGDIVMTYRFDTIVKNDLIAYKIDNEKKVGRVVAMEGDIVNLTDDGELVINGNVANEEIFYATTAKDSSIEYPYTVKAGEMFVLNDYRTLDSVDSRTIGGVKTSEVIGKVFFQLRRRGF